MKVFLFAVCAVFAAVDARGAGRAFPIDAENYVIDAFQRINRGIEWDETNFLVDLSGQYANCDFVGRSSFVDVAKLTPDGASIAAYVDDVLGGANDVNAVNSYLQSAIDSWTRNYGSEIYRQIEGADRFGCSVRPGCSGRVALSCLFSPARRQFNPPRDPTQSPDISVFAFTPEQYEVAERETKQVWGRNHFLENLSGREVNCNMIDAKFFDWPKAQAEAKKRGMIVDGFFGSSENVGETEPAMVKVLRSFKQKSGTKNIGCSLIPDCMRGGRMYVVVGCLYEQ